MTPARDPKQCFLKNPGCGILAVTMEGGFGGKLWREAVEGGCGGKLWRAAVEGSCGGKLRREAVKGHIWLSRSLGFVDPKQNS